MRLVDTSTRATRQLARVGVGEGGQYFAGLGFAGGQLALERGGCGEANNDPSVTRPCQLIRSRPLSFRPIGG